MIYQQSKIGYFNKRSECFNAGHTKKAQEIYLLAKHKTKTSGVVKQSAYEKHLGIISNSRLNFQEHLDK